MMTTLLNNPIITALGWTLIHSLWIALAFAGITRLFFTKVSAEKALLRYRLSLGSMLGILLVMVSIFVHYYTTFEAPEVPLGPEISMQAGDAVFLDWEQVAPPEKQGTFSWSQVSAQLERYFPILVILWFCGALFMGLRLAGSWMYLHKLGTQGLHEPDQEWNKLFHHLCTKMGIRRPVQLYWSDRVEEPVTLRHLKPIVLFPLGLLTQLSPEQIEIVLMHELAHIKRWDYLVNWLQSLLELLFFYHPAVWWLSAQVRTAREHCCDDLVLQADQQRRMLYAQTLTQLSVYSLKFKSKLAMSYNGNNQSFTFRVKRLFGQVDQSRMGQKPILSGLLILAFMALIMLNSNNLFAEKPNTETTEEFLMGLLDPEIRNLVLEEDIPVLDTIPILQKEKPSESTSTREEIVPTYFLNGEKISKAEFDQKGLTPDQISKVDVFKDGEIKGMRYPNGAVMIYTKDYVEKEAADMGAKALVLVDGKRIGFGKEKLESIDSEKIASVNAFKDEKAVEKYGSEAKNGVIEVFTKEYIANREKEKPAADAQPLIILDGVRQGFGKEKLNDLEPSQIASVTVLKGETATEKYGPEAKDGVVEVVTKVKDASQPAAEEEKEVAPVIIRGVRSKIQEKPLFVIDGVVVGHSTTDEEFQKLDPNDIESINVLKGEAATKKYQERGVSGVVEIKTKAGSQPMSTVMKMGKNLKKSVFKFGPKGSERKMNPLVVLNDQPIGRVNKVGQKFKEGEMNRIRFSGPSPALTMQFGEEAAEGVIFVNQEIEETEKPVSELDDAMVYVNGEKRGFWKDIKDSIDKTQIESINIYGKEVLPAEYANSPNDIVLVKLKGAPAEKGSGRSVKLNFKGKAKIAQPGEQPMEMDADDFSMTLHDLEPAKTEGEDKIMHLSAEEGISIQTFLHDNARHPLLILDGQVVAPNAPAIQNLAPDAVKRVILIEGGPALLPYGEAAKYGVLRIYTEAGLAKEQAQSNSIKISEQAFEDYLFKAGPKGAEKLVDPLVILNGKPIGQFSEVAAKNNIPASEIEQVTFTGFVEEALIQQYGETAREGIVYLSTKNSAQKATAQPLEKRINVFPNPFDESTRINFDLEQEARVKVSVFNAQGQLVKVLEDGVLPAGPQQFDWNSNNAPTGNYTVIVEGDGWRSSKTIVKQ